MAVYGGERGGYLEQQLETLFAQMNQDWTLLVRDDASPDRTLDILREWRARYPNRIIIIDEDCPSQLGVCGNFSRILETSRAPHVMLCDHDDLWYPDKVERAVAAMQRLEAKFGTQTPLLSHTDLRPVDGNLNVIGPSFWGLFGFSPKRWRSFGSVCLNAIVTGPSAIINQALIKKAGKIPPEAVYQDRWFEMTATAFGHIDARNEISMDYRRHTANASAATPSKTEMLLRILKNPVAWRQGYWQRREPQVALSRAFLERFRIELTDELSAAAEAVVMFRQLGFWQRRHAVIKHKLYYSSPLYTLAFLVIA